MYEGLMGYIKQVTRGAHDSLQIRTTSLWDIYKINIYHPPPQFINYPVKQYYSVLETSG